MNRRLLVLSVFLCTSFLAAFAQWGIKGGIDMSTFSSYNVNFNEDTNTGYKAGFHVGMTYDKALIKNFYFQPGLLFTLNGTKFNDVIPEFRKMTGDVSMYGLEIPLVFSFRPRIGKQTKLMTDLGFYTRCGLFGSYKFKYDYAAGAGSEYKDITVKGSPFDAYKRLDMGLHFGLGMEYKTYTLGAACQFGLSDVQEGSSNKHVTLRFSVGYRY